MLFLYITMFQLTAHVFLDIRVKLEFCSLIYFSLWCIIFINCFVKYLVETRIMPTPEIHHSIFQLLKSFFVYIHPVKYNIVLKENARTPFR